MSVVSLVEFKGRQTGSRSQSAPKVAGARQVERFRRPPPFRRLENVHQPVMVNTAAEIGRLHYLRPGNFGRSDGADETTAIEGGIDTIRNKKKTTTGRNERAPQSVGVPISVTGGKNIKKKEDGAVTGSVMRRRLQRGRFVVGPCCR